MLAEHRPRVTLPERQGELILAVVLVEIGDPAARSWRHTAANDLTAGSAVAALFLVTHSGPLPRDFLTYRGAASLAAQGMDAYAVDFAGQPFTYTPIATVALWPLTVLPAHASYAVWTVVSMVALAAVLPIGNVAVLTGVLLVACDTDLVSAHLDDGQVNLVLMALCTAGPAVLVGIAAAVKLTPALFGVHLLLTSQWRAAALVAAGFAGATLLGALLRPHMTVTYVRTVFWELSDRVDLAHAPSYYGNQSLRGVLAAAHVTAAPVVIAAAAVVLLGVARRLHDAGRHRDAWLVVGLSAPVLAPFSWNHHHVFVLPALVVLARRRCVPFVAACVVILHFRPGTGERLLQTGNLWTALPGVLLRENALLVALACILALALTPQPAPAVTR